MIESVRNIVGENASAEPADLAAYSYDSSGQEAEPLLVAWPADPDQVRKLILLCNRTNTPLVPRGLGTSTVGSTIAHNAIILDFTRMNRLYKAELHEKYIEVEPGVVLQSLNAWLQKRGYEFPLRPYTGEFCTIGGMISLDTIGPRSHKLGTMKDWLLSLEYLDGTGKHYLLTRDFERVAGWEGTTGIITKARLLVTETIQRTSASLLSFPSIHDLCQRLRELRREPDILAVDFLDKISSAYLGLDFKPHLVVEYYSDRGKVREQDQVTRILDKRKHAHDMLRLKGYHWLEDPRIKPERMEEFLAWLEAHELPCFGPAGLGIVFTMLRREDAEQRKALYEKVTTLNSTHASVLGWGNRKKFTVDLGVKHSLIKLKEDYDYNNILNRGKIIDFR